MSLIRLDQSTVKGRKIGHNILPTWLLYCLIKDTLIILHLQPFVSFTRTTHHVLNVSSKFIIWCSALLVLLNCQPPDWTGLGGEEGEKDCSLRHFYRYCGEFWKLHFVKVGMLKSVNACLKWFRRPVSFLSSPQRIGPWPISPGPSRVNSWFLQPDFSLLPNENTSSEIVREHIPFLQIGEKSKS